MKTVESELPKPGHVYFIALYTAPKVFNGLYFECLLTDQKIPAYARLIEDLGHIHDYKFEIWKPERFEVSIKKVTKMNEQYDPGEKSKIREGEILKQLSEKQVFEADFESVGMWITQRPSYCDRGSFLWHVESKDNSKITIDWADGFPRYYFCIDSMVNEINEWLIKRKIF